MFIYSMPDSILNGISWKTCTIGCCIQKLVKKLETRGSQSNACRLLSLGPIEGQSVQKYTPHNRTTQRCYTPRDSSRQHWHFGKSIPEFGETHSSALRCERRPVSASIMSRSWFALFPVCVYKFSSHYLNNIIFYRQWFGASSDRLSLYIIHSLHQFES